MSPKQIHDSLEVARAKPFIIRMSDGSMLNVPHTDYIRLMQDGEQAVLFENGNKIN
jgi:hypothetical protein